MTRTTFWMYDIWRRWVIANMAGEIVGFGLAAAAGGVLALAIQGLDGPTVWVVAALGVAAIGTLEGAAVGQAQWLALHPSLPRLARRAWLLATIAGAILAWGVGMVLGSAASESLALPDSPLLTLLGAALIGVVAGALLSAVQWLVLRRQVARAGWWLPAHAAAWAIGMLAAFAGMAFIQPDTPVPLIAAIGALTGLAMGALVASITGAVLVWMLTRPSTSPRPQIWCA